jgi:UDPglucose 6-dehydrogenase/GDP-mannose 6-dehydrogenase
MLDLLGRHFPDLDGVAVTVLGMAFKPGTDDIRESPSLEVTEQLLARGAVVTVFDPVAHRGVVKVFGDRVTHAEDLDSAVEGIQAILLMTRWSDFERIPELLRDRPRQPVVVDGRRLLAKDSVTMYQGIGL